MTIFLKTMLALSYVTMVAFNFLANALPLNAQTTGAVSAKYPTLFTPAGLTFSIWGLIYVMLGVYVVKMLWTPDVEFTRQLRVVASLFVFSALLNIGWLFAWHYDRIALSTIVIAALLCVTIAMMVAVKGQPFIVRAPFSLYAGWLSVALIANVSIWLVSSGVSSYAPLSVALTIAVLLTGVVIAGCVAWFWGDIVFVIVFIWAYGGILLRHLEQSDLPQRFNAVIGVSVASLFILLAMVIFTLIRQGGKVFP